MPTHYATVRVELRNSNDPVDVLNWTLAQRLLLTWGT